MYVIYSFFSTHNEQLEAMDESQKAMVEKFMDTSLRYLHGDSKNGLYSMVIRCLEVRMFMCVIVSYMRQVIAEGEARQPNRFASSLVYLSIHVVKVEI